MIKTLIVEDDPMVAKFNRVYVEKVEGFEPVGTITDVKQAWDFLKENTVDLILLDVYMKNTTGLEMLMEMRKTGSPVDAIVITAANDNQSIQTALRYGAVDYLIKPFHFDRFKESLLRYRHKQEIIEKGESVTQADLDPFLLQSQRVSSSVELPKGLTTLTFSHIAKQILKKKQEAFSAADIADKTGISQVSVRKYLHYLVDSDVLETDVIYQSTGRPLHQYRLNPEKAEFIQSLQVAEEQ
ncbi:response regulator of citrate/malate metabolism [Salibacterium salarium]|uniref:response regulator n=1 Tax=Salibacterium salarium TaxID=284579 RepID=UPI0027835B6A|nr:response regulator [Salibacterium salarium]MDQ0298128.1 response regulator of citrate/malate metabolism [Salibacterium salarium]